MNTSLKVYVTIILFMLSGISAAGTDQNKTIIDLKNGISYEIMPNWKKCESTQNICISVPTGEKQTGEISITVLNMNLNESIPEEFEKSGEKWLVNNAQTKEALEIHENGLNGIYAIFFCGIGDEFGMHTGTCIKAIISNGLRTVIIEATGTVDERDVIDPVIKSFKFIEVK